MSNDQSTLSRRGVLAASGAAGAGLVLGVGGEAQAADILTAAQVRSVLRIARFGVAVMTPVVAAGNSEPSLDRATSKHLLSVAAGLGPERLALIRKAADSLAARGLSTATDQALRVALAAAAKAPTDDVLALVALAAATVTPIVSPTADDLAAVWLTSVARIAAAEKGDR
ncbi:twin-arginine translocation signal domain-containing protein [Kribbella sp. NPDC051952]|uniref:twin-arginine translocation signal domain-containing protein n=1 Tax=Kribbella sp. NPDC051952 TaxID=3154851 RepID=UPI0034390D14